MNNQPIPVGIVGERSTYARRNWVLSPEGCAPCVVANWGAKSPPPPLVAVEVSE